MQATVRPVSGNQREESFPQPAQLSLPFDPSLLSQHRSLKDCVAACVYRQRGGVTAVAGRLDLSPSHLSEALGGVGERGRKFDLDWLEDYITSFGDPTPVLYLIAKYMGDTAAEQQNAIAELQHTLSRIPGLVATINTGARKR